MIPVLRSIDNLLDHFDELTQRHASLVADMHTNFIKTKQPLRDEDEQRRTSDDLTMGSTEQIGSSGSNEDLNRIIPTNRPPSFSSNDSSFYRRIPSRSSWATAESNAPQPVPIRQETAKTNNSSITINSIGSLIGPKGRVTSKTKQRVLPPNPLAMRRNARSAITSFTMETAIRLSRPKTCYRLPMPIVSPKRVHLRPKTGQPMKKEFSASSVASVPVDPPSRSPSSKTKRTNPTVIQSPPKKHKADNSKKVPTSIYPRPIIFLAPPPTIHLTFPMQSELKPAHTFAMPKPHPIIPISTKKTYNIFTNKPTIIPPNRFKYLMS
jgi:hypothetical protein